MPFDVAVTITAQRGLDGLRNTARRRANAWLDDVAARGCEAMDYRLTGPAPLSKLCCVHLRGPTRAIVAFRDDLAVVLLVGRHDERDAGMNIYDLLYTLVGHSPKPVTKRTKPPCCEADTSAPILDQEQIDDLVERSRTLLRRHKQTPHP